MAEICSLQIAETKYVLIHDQNCCRGLTMGE